MFSRMIPCLIAFVFAFSLAPAADLDWPDAFKVFEPNPGWMIGEEEGQRVLIYVGDPGEQLHRRDWITDELFSLEYKQSARGSGALAR